MQSSASAKRQTERRVGDLVPNSIADRSDLASPALSARASWLIVQAVIGSLVEEAAHGWGDTLILALRAVLASMCGAVAERESMSRLSMQMLCMERAACGFYACPEEAGRRNLSQYAGSIRRITTVQREEGVCGMFRPPRHTVGCC